MNEVGNFVKAVLPRLVGKPAQDALSSLDISLTDKEGNLRDIIQVYTEVAEKIKGIADSERIAVVEGLAGKFHISRMQALLDDLGSADSMYRSMYESSTNAAGSAEAENEKYMKSLEARMALARVEVEKLALAMGEAFLQEGMIQAIQVFGDMLGILTKLTGSIGALPIVLGATGVAVFALSSRFRTLVAAITMGTTSMNTNKAASIGMTKGMTGAAVATTTLKTAMRGLLAASGVGLVLVGIGMAAEFLLGKIGDAREKSEELASFNKNLAASYKDNKDTIDELSASYIELDNKRANGELGLVEQKEYLDVQNQLAELLPDLVLAEDAKGNKILGGSEIVKGHIELLRERLAIEQELKAEQDRKQSEERYDTAKGSYNDVKKEIDGVLDYIDTAVRSVNQQFGSQLDFTKMFSINPNDIKSYDDALAKLEQLNQKKNEIKASDTGYQDNPIYQYYDQASQAIAQYTQKYNDASMQQRSYLQAMKSEVLSQASSVIMANADMSESAKNFAAELANAATKGSTTASQLDKIKSSITNLKVDDSATASIKKFEQAFSSASKATGENVDEMKDKLVASSGEMKQALLDASGLDINSGAYKELSSVLDQLADSKVDVIDKAYEMAESQGLTFEQAMNNITALEEEADATSALEDKRYALISAAEQLSGVSQNLINDTDDLLFMYDELALSTAGQAEEDARLIGVKQQLLGLYPHLFAAGTTALNMTDEQINAVRAEVKATDVLMAAYAAKRDGKLTTEQEATLAQLANTNARIKNINAEIDGLSKLAAAYRNFAGSAIETANEYAKAGLDGEAEEAFIRAQKFSGFARQQEGLAHAELARNTSERTRLTNILSKSMEVANRTTTGGNRAARDNAKANSGAAKAKDKNAKASKKQTKAQKEATKAMEKSIFVANKYKLALENIELQIKKQQSLQSKFSTHTDQYRKAFASEITLQKEKVNLMEKQSAELQKQIKAGNILKTGVVTTTTTSTKKTGKLSGFSGSINSKIGYRRDPVTGKKKAHHDGIDIGAREGTRLDAPVSGTVVRNAKVGQYGGLGNAIVIKDAQGFKHIFGHLSKSIVTLGQKITVGQQIGNTGNTGKSSGPHLHYELRDAKGNVKDPMKYINAAKKGSSITTTNTSKEAAQNLYDIEGAKSELTSLQSSILDQKDLIEQLQAELINIDLGAFEKRYANYQMVIDTEAEKADLLDKSSRRYQNSLQRQYQFTDYQKQVVEEQIKYLNNMIKKAGLSKKAQDELGDQVKLLTKDLYSLEVQLKNITFEKIATTSRMFAEKLEDISYSLSRSNSIMSLFKEGSKEYNKELKNQIGYLQQQKKITADQRDSLQKSLLLHDLTIEQQKELSNQIKELTLNYWDLEVNIKSTTEALEESQKKMANEAADSLIEAYKGYLEQRQEAHLKSLDKELDAENKKHENIMKNYKEELEAYRKIVNEKINSLNKEEDSRLYEKEIEELNKQKLVAQEKFNLLSKDDSFEAKAERKKLQEEMTRIDEELFEKRHRKELDVRIENLNGMLEAKEEQTSKEEELETERHDKVTGNIEKEKEYWTKFYEDQLNDERHFAKMREEILAGNFDNITKEFQDYIKEMRETMPDLENTLDGTMEAVGTSIRKNIIDSLKEALSLLSEVQGETSRPSQQPGTSKPGTTGTDTGVGGGAGGKSTLSKADMKVIAGKFFVDKLMDQEPNKNRKAYVKQHGYDSASQGRKEGSKIDSVIRYDALVQQMTPADRAAFGKFLSSYGTSVVSTPALQEYIKKIASGLMGSAAGFDTGGYTGSWGSSGKMAVLHEKELVLNKNQTQDILKTASIMDRIKNLINPLSIPSINKPVLAGAEGSGDINYNFDFHVDKMTGSAQDVKDFTKMITDDLKRNRGLRR